MLCYYSDIIVLEVNNCITYNNRSSLLLTGNLTMLYVEIKETIWNELEWNYIDIDIEITCRYQIDKQQSYPVPIAYDDSFKKMIDSFIQTDLNIIILYVSS